MAARILRQSLKMSNLMSGKPRVCQQCQLVRAKTTSETGSFMPEPERQAYGLFGVTVTVMAGLFVGATISQNIASFLEENELFVPSDDDDDDD